MEKQSKMADDTSYITLLKTVFASAKVMLDYDKIVVSKNASDQLTLLKTANALEAKMLEKIQLLKGKIAKIQVEVDTVQAGLDFVTPLTRKLGTELVKKSM